MLLRLSKLGMSKAWSHTAMVALTSRARSPRRSPGAVICAITWCQPEISNQPTTATSSKAAGKPCWMLS